MNLITLKAPLIQLDGYNGEGETVPYSVLLSYETASLSLEPPELIPEETLNFPLTYTPKSSDDGSDGDSDGGDGGSSDTTSPTVLTSGGGGIIVTSPGETKDEGKKEEGKTLIPSSSSKSQGSNAPGLDLNFSKPERPFSDITDSSSLGTAFIYISRGGMGLGEVLSPQVRLDLKAKTEEVNVTSPELILPTPDTSPQAQTPKKPSFLDWLKGLLKQLLFWLGFSQ